MSDKVSYLVSWEDKVSGNVRNFHLNFYPDQSSVDMVDLKTKKTFLRKTETDQVGLADLFIGNTIKLYSRLLKVVDYADEDTRSQMSHQQQHTLGLLLPGDAMDQMGEFITRILVSGLTLARARMVHMTELQAGMFYDKRRGDPDYPELVARLSSGPSLALELVGRDSVSVLLDIVSEDIAHGSVSEEVGREEIELLFPQSKISSMENAVSYWSGDGHKSSCLVVLPHVMEKVGEVVEMVMERWEVLGLETHRLDFARAEEFLEVYKGVVDHYGDMVGQLCSGMCLVMEIGGGGDKVVERLREFCGPQDPHVARLLRPQTIRARFGDNLVKNAVHCTDLPEDGQLEVEYFFKVLQ